MSGFLVFAFAALAVAYLAHEKARTRSLAALEGHIRTLRQLVAESAPDRLNPNTEVREDE